MIKSKNKIINVYVDPEKRGMRVCQKMLKYLIKHTDQKVLYLEVLKDNEKAIKCYQKVGFEIWKTGYKYHHMKIDIL